MSGSETGGAVMTTREPFTVASHSQPVMQNMRLAYSADGAAVYKPVGSSPPPQSAASGGGGTNEGQATGSLMPHNLNVNLGETVKKKRGRPRKYGPDGTMALALMPTPAPDAIAQAAGTISPPSHPTQTSGGPVSPSSLKKGRGRPPGSSKKQQMEALGNYCTLLYVIFLMEPDTVPLVEYGMFVMLFVRS